MFAVSSPVNFCISLIFELTVSIAISRGLSSFYKVCERERQTDRDREITSLKIKSSFSYYHFIITYFKPANHSRKTTTNSECHSLNPEGLMRKGDWNFTKGKGLVNSQQIHTLYLSFPCEMDDHNETWTQHWSCNICE